MNDERCYAYARRSNQRFRNPVIRMYLALPKNELARILGRQVVRSGTSPGAHCREAFRARSDAELISKLETALQELDETVYWFELLIESETVPAPLLKPLITEADELMAIIVTSVKTVKRRRRR